MTIAKRIQNDIASGSGRPRKRPQLFGSQQFDYQDDPDDDQVDELGTAGDSNKYDRDAFNIFITTARTNGIEAAHASPWARNKWGHKLDDIVAGLGNASDRARAFFMAMRHDCLLGREPSITPIDVRKTKCVLCYGTKPCTFTVYGGHHHHLGSYCVEIARSAIAFFNALVHQRPDLREIDRHFLDLMDAHAAKAGNR